MSKRIIVIIIIIGLSNIVLITIRNAHLNDIKADFRASSDKYIPFGVPVVPLENIIAHGQFLFIGFVGGTNRLSEATIFE